MAKRNKKARTPRRQREPRTGRKTPRFGLWVAVLLVVFFIPARRQYNLYLIERDFELQCAYHYCYLRIIESDQERDASGVEHYYRIAKDFERRIRKREGMETAINEVEVIFGKYNR